MIVDPKTCLSSVSREALEAIKETQDVERAIRASWGTLSPERRAAALEQIKAANRSIAEILMRGIK